MAKSTTHRLALGLLAVSSAFVLTACDLAVSNPGPMQDEFLDNPAAHEAVVGGMALSLSKGLALVVYIGSEAAMEYTQSGRLIGTKLPIVPGELTHESIGSGQWNLTQRARWVAEDGVRRMEATNPNFASSPVGARALLYAGYANRILGENMCEAVIDVGPAQPHTVHFERARDYFGRAIDVAGQAGDAAVTNAARAGRASVRLLLGDHAGAAADAALVPNAFVLRAEYSSGEVDLYNFVFYSNNNAPYRAHSVIDTYYDQYYTETGDPRVAWQRDPGTPGGDFSFVPWFEQQKHTSLSAPINLSSGREMRLIEAEAALMVNDWPRAMELINGLRATVISDISGAPIPPWQASNVEEAWTALKRERGIELWLEGRRLGDLRRWYDNDTPGAMEDMSTRPRLCFPIAQSERQTNPNIALDHDDPRNPRYTGPPPLPAEIDYSGR